MPSLIGKKNMFSISKIDKSDLAFYEILGPVFGSREIAKEVGIHCYADAGKQFFIAMVDDKLIGLLSLNRNVISDCYVYPAFRRTGVLTELLDKATINKIRYKATCTVMSKGIFAKRGFTVVSETKNFTFMEMNNA